MSIEPILPGTYLGRGCDLSSGFNYGEGLEFHPALPVIENGAGQQVVFDLRQITSTNELMQSLNLTASASFAGTFSVSAEAKYASQQQINQYNTYLLVSVRVTNPELIIRQPKLKPDAFQLLKDRGWEAFEQQYGTDYLSGLVTGGSYYGLIEISTQSKEEQQTIAAAVSASYGIFKSSGELDAKLKQAIQNKELKVKILQSGGSGDSLEISLEEMIEQAKNFPAMARQHPVPFQGLYEEYSKTVPLPPAIGEGSLTKLHRTSVMEELGQRYLEYKDYRSDLIYVLQNLPNFKEYASLEAEELRQKRTQFDQDLKGITEQMNDLERRARLCRDSIQACELPATYYSPTEPLPAFDGENKMLKELQAELRKVQTQVEELQKLQQAIKVSGSSVGIGTSSPKAKLHVADDIVLGRNTNGQKFILHSRSNGRGEFLQITSDTQTGDWQWEQGVTLRRDGKLGIGTARPQATLDVNGDVKIKGSEPIHIRQYNGSHINTGYSTDDWVATIAGFRALDGDIQENDSGDMIQVYTYAHEGNWYYLADVRSHNRHEKFVVWVMFIRRELVSV